MSLLSLVVPVQECPSGIVNEENFKQIYSQFFPQGGEEMVHTQGVTVVHPRLRGEVRGWTPRGNGCPSLG